MAPVPTVTGDHLRRVALLAVGGLVPQRANGALPLCTVGEWVRGDQRPEDRPEQRGLESAVRHRRLHVALLLGGRLRVGVLGEALPDRRDQGACLGTERRRHPTMMEHRVRVSRPSRIDPRESSPAAVRVSRSTPPTNASSSSTCSIGCGRPSSCTGSPRSRPGRSSRWTGWPSRARSTRRCTSSQRLHAAEDARAELGLHFDLTVPFARYVLENAHQLAFPFRRYQIQKVWRGERPQEGRYREFTQADIDIVDATTLAAHHDVELPLVTLQALERLHTDLGLPPVLMRVNNRRLAQGFYAGLGIADPAAVLRQVDKLDKIGPDKVGELLVEQGLTDAQATACVGLADISSRRCVVRRPGPRARRERSRAGCRARAAGRGGGDGGPARARPAGRRPEDRPRAGLLHRHRLRDRAGRLRVLGVGVLRRPVRLTGLRRQDHVPRASGCPSGSPGCWRRCSPAGC